MGLYINPSNMSKEEWLSKHGVRHSSTPTWSRDNMPVCLMNNGMFTAAGIAFSADELDVFNNPDGRHKVWYTVPRDKLEEVEPALKRMK